MQLLWNRYLALRREARPADYEVCYPQSLLDSLAQHVIDGCRLVGLRAFQDSPSPGPPTPDIPILIKDAWNQFLGDADAYPAWEQARLAEVWVSLGFNQP